MSDCREFLPTSPLASTIVVDLFTPSIPFYELGVNFFRFFQFSQP